MNITKKRDRVIDRWLNQDDVTTVFNKFKIDKLFFKNSYGISIFNCLANSVRGYDISNSAISEGIDFFVDRGIKIRDIYIIYKSLRDIFIDECDNKILINNVFEEILEYIFEHYDKVLDSSILLNQKNSLINEYLNFLNQYKNVIDKTSIVSRTDKNGVIIYANEQFCKISGYSLEELIGKPHNIVRHPNMPKSAFKDMWQTIKGKFIWSGVVWNKAKNGDTYIVNSTIVPILDIQGNITEYISIRQDITAMVLSFKKLINSIYDSHSSPIMITSNAKEIIFLNKAFLRILNFESLKEFFDSGISIVSKFSLENPNICQKQNGDIECFVNSVNNHKVVNVNIKDGFATKTFSIKRVDIYDTNLDYNVLNVIYFIDMTDIEQLRISEVQNTKLASIGKLAAGITHEINTPLTYIKGNLELLKLDIDCLDITESQKSDFNDLMSDIFDGIFRISTTVESMKEFAGNKSAEKIKSNLFSTIVYACRIAFNYTKHYSKVYINDKLFNLTLDKDDEVYDIKIASQQMEQLWIILINNSIDEFKHSTLNFDERYIKFEIEENSEFVNIRVIDNAGGIPEHILSNIF